MDYADKTWPPLLERLSEASLPQQTTRITPLPRPFSEPLAATPDDLRLELVTSLVGLDALRADWEALCARAARPDHVFQSFGFVVLTARHFLAAHGPARCARSGCTCRIAVVTGWRGNRLVLVWPLVVQRQMGLDVLTTLGEPVGQYSDAIVDKDEPALPCLKAAWHHALATTAPDLVRLRKVRADAVIAPLMDEIGATRRGDPTEAPFITLKAGGSSLEERQSGKARKNRRRLRRRLEEQGEVSFRAAVTGETSARLINHALVMKRDWLRRRGLFSPVLADRRLDLFLHSVASDEQTSTGARTYALEQLDGQPIAVAMGFASKNRLTLHLIAQTEAAERYGSGVLNLEAVLHAAEAEGFEAVDMLPPRADYKLDWADGSVEVADHACGRTLKGRICAAVFDGWLRPRLKRAIERLPLGLRQRIAVRALAD